MGVYMKRVLLIIISMLVSFSMFAAGGLYAIENDDLKVTVNNRKSVSTYITEDNVQISVVVESSVENGYYRYGVDIVNLSDKKFRFKEDSISILQGDYDIDDWRNIRFKKPSVYYQDKETALTLDTMFTVLSFGAAFLDAFNPPPIGHRYFHYAPHHNGALMFGMGVAGIFSQMEDANNLAYLRDNLLFSTTIAPGDEYSGFIYVPRGFGPDYLVKIEISDSETAEFYFSKSRYAYNKRDDSSAHRNKRQSRAPERRTRAVQEEEQEPEISIGNGTLGILFDFGIPFQDLPGFGTGVIYTTDTLGFYATADFYTRFDVPSINYFCFSTGITYNVFSDISLMFGFGLDFSDRYYYGDIPLYKANGPSSQGWIKDPETGFSFAPQIGVNFVLGPLDLATVYSFRIGDTLISSRLNLMAGIAF